MIEPKGHDCFPVKNHVRIVFASNSDWVVPAGVDERRFFFLDVNPAFKQDHKYFAAICDQMENGGYEAMLHDLLQVDLSGVNLRQPPESEGLFEQKLYSLDSIARWWFTRLMDGAQVRESQVWQAQVPTQKLHDDYASSSKTLGYGRIEDTAIFARRLRKLCPGICGPHKITIPEEFGIGFISKRVRALSFPGIEECRVAFEEMAKVQVTWEENDG